MTITGPDVLTAAGIFVLLGTAVGTLWRYFMKPVFDLMQRTNEFLDDWLGTPDRPGVPGRPGVMARLASVEDNMVDREEFRRLADEVAAKASAAELLELRVALQRHITRVEESREVEAGDVPHPREGS